MASEYLGLALVIANNYCDKIPDGAQGRDPLKGTLEDSRDYDETFREYLKYKVVVRNNLTGNGIRTATDELISEARYCPFGCAHACIVFVFCGHGDEGVIVGQDGAEVNLGEIFQRFTSIEGGVAPLMKLFFIDACRGRKEDKGVRVSRGGELVLSKLVPAEGNMLAAYSTLPQYKAYELTDRPRGLFSYILNQELRKDENIEESLENIITIVTQRMVEKSKEYKDVRFQTPQKVSTLRYILKPLKEAKEFQSGLALFQPQPVPAPRRKKLTPNQDVVPPLQGSQHSPSPLRPGAVSAGEGMATGGGQVFQYQTVSTGSMYAAQQPQSMAHQSHMSGWQVAAPLATPAAPPIPGMATPTSYMVGATPTSYMSGVMPTPYTSGVTPTSYTSGVTPTSYTSGAMPSSYIDGATPTQYTLGAMPTQYTSGATPAQYTPGATPTLYMPGATPNPLRPTSTPSLAHFLPHRSARREAQLIAEQAGETLKKNFTKEPTRMGTQYGCEVEFVHCGRPYKGKSCCRTSKDGAWEEACQDLLNLNPSLLQSTAPAPTAGAGVVTHGRVPPSMEPSPSYLGAPPMGSPALQTASVMARSVATPPSLTHNHQEHPHFDHLSTCNSDFQSGHLPTGTNYQGQPQSASTPPTNNTIFQGQPQPVKTPKMQLKELCERKRLPIPQYTTPPFGIGFQSTVLVSGLGRVTGNEKASKKAAEQDAAEKALRQLSLM